MKPRFDIAEITLLSLIVFPLIYFNIGIIFPFIAQLENSQIATYFLIILVFSALIFGAYHSDRQSKWKKEHPS